MVKRGRLFRFVVLLVAIYFISTLVNAQIQITRKREELQQINLSCEEQRVANKELERQLMLYQDEDYLHRAAREELGYGAPDEQLFIDSSGN